MSLSKDSKQEQFGWRYDYDGEVVKDGVTYNKIQIQPNAGKVPSPVKQFREANGGTHAVAATAFVKKGATQEEVQKALDDAHSTIKL